MTNSSDHQSLDRNSFDTLVVRPIEPSERSRWNEEMRTHHYLGFRTMPGESIRYVALLDGEWVALLGWGSAAWSNGHRDRMIGWTIPQRARRLCYLANNLRYLILPKVFSSPPGLEGAGPLPASAFFRLGKPIRPSRRLRRDLRRPLPLCRNLL